MEAIIGPLALVFFIYLAHLSASKLYNQFKSTLIPTPSFIPWRKWLYSPSFQVKQSKTFSTKKEPGQPSLFPRLGRSVPEMKPEYDVLVVGSGYGGGVAASRMARTGKSVAIFELGRERWPGEYPSKLTEVLPELHCSGKTGSRDHTFGKPTGMYHVIRGEGQNVFVANGLGGTSLVNANVFLRADARTLQLNEWPSEIRDNPDNLDQYYTRAEHMLQPTAYPTNYPTPEKLSVFQKQAHSIGIHDSFYRVPQTTFFHNGLNNAGVQMKASTGSGQDCTGVNDGSKNSVLMNYLPDAWNHGAEIFCECEVRYVRRDPAGNGYLVFFAWHGDGRRSFKDSIYEQLMWVRAKEFVFLGAGALGTTEILLRSQALGMKMSPLVGQKISGNGDMLSFGYNTNRIINGVGSEKCPSTLGPCGPTITGIIDKRGDQTSLNVENGYVIQEGAIPEALAPLIQTMLDACPNKIYPKQYSWKKYYIGRLKNMFLGPYCPGSSINRTQAYLIMAHDNNEGIMTMDNDKPALQFCGVKRTGNVDDLHRELGRMADAVGGILINAPETTVHPLGGARMSSDGTGRTGAVNHLGQLYTGVRSDVYEGIVCLDASVIPTSLGVNPFATITALAERSCNLLIEKNGWIMDESPNGPIDLFGTPAKANHWPAPEKRVGYSIKAPKSSDDVYFSEVLEGNIHTGGDIDDFSIADRIAKGASSSARLYLTVNIPSVENLVNQSEYTATATGTFACGAFSQNPLLVTSGEVQFFKTDPDAADGTNFVYKLRLLSAEGETFTLEGHKDIDSRMVFSAPTTWKATTTLYTTIKRPNGAEVGKGILHVSWRNFLNEMQTFGSNDSSTPKMIVSVTKFLSFFLKQTTKYFSGPFQPLEYPDTSTSDNLTKPLPRVVTLTAEDGVKTTMKIWEPKPGAPKHSMPILMIPGASVDDQVYSCPTIPINTVDYFTALGYRCYVLIVRFGMSPEAKKGYTCYDARWDVKAAVDYVRKQEHERKFYAIVHCLGSISTSMALLTGLVKPEWLVGMSVSQVFCNLRYSQDNKFKARHPSLMKLYQAIGGDWFPSESSSEDLTSSPQQFVVDQILRFYPMGSAAETCNNSVCHRTSLVFGRCFTHANLNHATHQHMTNYFSGIHMNFLKHLSTMGATAPYHVRTNLNPSPLTPDADTTFRDLVTEPGNLERLRGLKIQFVSGGANVVFDPLSTADSYNLMREMFGDEGYERVVVDTYGHLDTWMGKRSFKDVYPRVEGFLRACEESYEDDDEDVVVIEKSDVMKRVSGKAKSTGRSLFSSWKTG